MRRVLNSIVVGTLTGALVLSVAWATSGLIPVDRTPARGGIAATPVEDGASISSADVQAIAEGGRLPGGLFKVGGADVSIAPVQFPEGQWLKHDPSESTASPGDMSDGDINCNVLHNSAESGEAQFYWPFAKPSCLKTFDARWATTVDEASDLGIFARATAISNGETTLAFVAIDTVSWFYGFDPRYCPDETPAPNTQDTCGARAIANSISEDMTAQGVNLPPQNVVISATHTHASADTAMGGPSWYLEHVRDSIKQAITEAIDNMQLATIETGAGSAKPFNVDRRIVTRAIPDPELTWLRGVAAPPSSGDPGPVPPGETISTLVNFSVHTTVTAGNKDLHSGFVGHLANELREHWGGNAVFMVGGLGDQTVHRGFGRDGHGDGLAHVVLDSALANGYTLQSNGIVTEQQVIQVPGDNLSLAAANKANIFARDTTIPGPHANGPATSIQTKGGASSPSCVGASPISARVPVGGFLIGSPGSGDVKNDPANYQGDAVAIMQTPGEIFASISVITKDYLSKTRNVMVFGNANDHIGYIIPAQQYDIRSANAAGLTAPSTNMTDYEESLSSGRCTGDQVQNALLDIATNLGIVGIGEGR
jgi:hypothetical protein